MKTILAEDMCNDFSKSSLEQIAKHCASCATILAEQAIMRNKNSENLKECLEYIEDSNDFKMLHYYLNKVIQHIE